MGKLGHTILLSLLWTSACDVRSTQPGPRSGGNVVNSENVEIYPMPAFPTLEVRDPLGVAKWYQEVLGFQHVFSLPGPERNPRLVHLRWAKYADILLRPEVESSKEQKGAGVILTFALDGLDEVDALAERARRHGAQILSEPKNQPWNVRDFSVADPEGFRLVFTFGPVNEAMTFDQVVEHVRP